MESCGKRQKVHYVRSAHPLFYCSVFEGKYLCIALHLKEELCIGDKGWLVMKPTKDLCNFLMSLSHYHVYNIRVVNLYMRDEWLWHKYYSVLSIVALESQKNRLGWGGS